MASRWNHETCSECRTHHPNGWACPKELKRLRAENERLREIEKAIKPHLDEALEILHDSIEDEDFQPCFDKENFMVGSALLGNLNRIFDAVVKARAATRGGD